MRLLMLNHNVAWSGGTFFRAYHFARHLVAAGHEVTVVSISRDRRWRPSIADRHGVTVIESPDLLWGRGRTGWDPWDSAWRIHHLRNIRVDIIHAFESRPAVVLPALATQRRNGAALVMDWADWWGRGGIVEERSEWWLRWGVGPIETYFEEAFRTRADATTVVSDLLADRAVAMGVRRESILHLLHGCDADNVRRFDKGGARQELGLPRGVPIVGHLGGFLPRDLVLLLDAFRLVKADVPDARLLLAGGASAKIAEQLGPAPDVICTGSVRYEAIPKYLCAADVLVLPLSDCLANRARWPSKLNDYLAAGQPIVATSIGEVEQLFTRYDAGVLAAPGADDLARQVIALLADEVKQARVGEAARRLAEGELSWEVLTSGLVRFYQQVLARRGAPEP